MLLTLLFVYIFVIKYFFVCTVHSNVTNCKCRDAVCRCKTIHKRRQQISTIKQKIFKVKVICNRLTSKFVIVFSIFRAIFVYFSSYNFLHTGCGIYLQLFDKQSIMFKIFLLDFAKIVLKSTITS